MNKLSTTGAIVFGVTLAGGIVLAIFGGEYASHAELLFGAAIGFLTRTGAIGAGAKK